MEENVLVSVVIPVYNVEHYICDSLESIVNQSYNNIEIIIVDDGSTDSSIQVARDYLKGTTRRWEVITQENKGQAAARNNGIRHANGDWVICPDSDDYLVEGTIERLLSAALKHNTYCACCNLKRVDQSHLKDHLSLQDKDMYLPIDTCRKLFFSREIEIIAPGTLINRKLFDRVSYDEDCPFTEDTHFLWKLLYVIDSLVFVTGDYYNYLRRPGSTLRTLTKEKYLKTSRKFEELGVALTNSFPNDFYASRIWPRQRLGALHMLAWCNEFDTFKETVIDDGYRRGMNRLFICGNMKVSLLSLVFCLSLRLFYRIQQLDKKSK